VYINQFTLLFPKSHIMHCTPHPKKAETQSKIQSPDARARLEPKNHQRGPYHQNIKSKQALLQPDIAERSAITAETEGYANIPAERAFYFTPLRASTHRCARDVKSNLAQLNGNDRIRL
jgi:hypothetical protein